MSNFIFWSI